MGYWASLGVLASAIPSPGHPPSSHAAWTAWAPVVVVACGLIGLYILVWGPRRQQAGPQARHPRRDLLGWVLILACCVGLSLLTEHVEVSSGLSLTVNSLACVMPTAFTFWVGQKTKDRAHEESSANQAFQDLSALIRAVVPGQANGRAVPGAENVSQPDGAGNVAFLKIASQGGGAEAAGPGTLADAQQAVHLLRAQVAALRSRVLSAVLAHGPGQDWRPLLAGPRFQLGSCTALLDQLGESRSRWADFGATSFALSDTYAAAHRAAASLSEAIEERTAGQPARTDLGEAARRLDRVVGQLAELVDRAALDP